MFSTPPFSDPVKKMISTVMNIVMLYQPKRTKARHSYAIGNLYHSTEVLEPSHSLPTLLALGGVSPRKTHF